MGVSPLAGAYHADSDAVRCKDCGTFVKRGEPLVPPAPPAAAAAAAAAAPVVIENAVEHLFVCPGLAELRLKHFRSLAATSPSVLWTDIAAASRFVADLAAAAADPERAPIYVAP
jgi:hypothetical protein